LERAERRKGTGRSGIERSSGRTRAVWHRNDRVSVIAVTLSRGARNWCWAKARLDIVDSKDVGKPYLMLTKEQDEEAVLRLREKYIIAGAPKY
jgi:hypothetical protein